MPSGNTTMPFIQLLLNTTAHALNRSQHKHLGPLLSPNIIKCAWLQSCILFEGFHYYSGKDFILQCLKSHHPKRLRENHLVKNTFPEIPFFAHYLWVPHQLSLFTRLVVQQSLNQKHYTRESYQQASLLAGS